MVAAAQPRHCPGITGNILLLAAPLDAYTCSIQDRSQVASRQPNRFALDRVFLSPYRRVYPGYIPSFAAFIPTDECVCAGIFIAETLKP